MPPFLDPSFGVNTSSSFSATGPVAIPDNDFNGEIANLALARLRALPAKYQCLAPELQYPENLRAGLAAR